MKSNVEVKAMWDWTEFEIYLDEIGEVLGRPARCGHFRDYTHGLLLPLERKSIEPIAAHVDPVHVSAKHQALHHFVANADGSDAAVLERVRDWVLPELNVGPDGYWVVDDTGFPKKGSHSVGVAHPYCSQVGKQANCQVAVSFSLSTERGSLPVQWQLYLPKAWADDGKKRTRTGVPKRVRFATKPQMALTQIRATRRLGVPAGTVLADAAYGNDTAFRTGVTRFRTALCRRHPIDDDGVDRGAPRPPADGESARGGTAGGGLSDGRLAGSSRHRLCQPVCGATGPAGARGAPLQSPGGGMAADRMA